MLEEADMKVKCLPRYSPDLKLIEEMLGQAFDLLSLSDLKDCGYSIPL